MHKGSRRSSLTIEGTRCLSYPLWRTVLLHGSIKHRFPTLSLHAKSRYKRIHWKSYTRKRHTQRKASCWMIVAPRLFLYASSGEFTPIQRPPRRSPSAGYFGQTSEMCWWVCVSGILVGCWSSAVTRGVLVVVVWAENLRMCGPSLCPPQLHLWTPQWCHWKDWGGICCTEGNVRSFLQSF